MEKIWNEFIGHLTKTEPESLSKINPPATTEQLNEAKAILGSVFHEDIEQLYHLANGFTEGAYLLRDDYRILPIDEMIKQSLALAGKRIFTDYEAGQSRKIKKGDMIVLALAEEDNCDVEKISISVTRGKTNVAIWFKEDGIHDYEEVIDTSETLEEWLTSVLEYYS